MCAGAVISASSRLSANSSNHSGRSRKRSFESFESFAGFRDQFPGAISSLRFEAGLDDVLVGVLDESCEDELDNAGTTIGTKFSVLHKKYFPCLSFIKLVIRTYGRMPELTGRVFTEFESAWNFTLVQRAFFSFN